MSLVIPCVHGMVGRCETCSPRSDLDIALSTDRVEETPTYADLVALIRQAEWSNGDMSACPWCERAPDWKKDKGTREDHDPGCPAARVLYPEERS